jgi:GNAT superfamily N-acetyltransferase
MSTCSSGFEIVPYMQKPELAEQVAELGTENYPTFIEGDPVWAEVFPGFYKEFAEFQFFLVETGTGRLAAVSRNVPFYWDGVLDHLPGYHRMLQQSLVDWRGGKKANALSTVEVVIHQDFRGGGLAELVTAEVTRLARQHGIAQVVSAIRPTLKHLYPLAKIEDYATWRREDGELLDPWLRSWDRMGAEQLKTEPASTVIEASVAQWQKWMDMDFPVSGEYWLPGGLSTLTINLEDNLGRHCEPHVWYRLHVQV